MAVVHKNAEVVREAFERWAGDDVDRVLELYTPDVILDTGGFFLPAGVHRGIGEVREALSKILSEQTIRATRHLDLEVSGDWVLAVAHFDDDFENACLFRLHDGLIAQIEAPSNSVTGVGE